MIIDFSLQLGMLPNLNQTSFDLPTVTYSFSCLLWWEECLAAATTTSFTSSNRTSPATLSSSPSIAPTRQASLLNISFRCFNRWRVVLHCVVGYSILRVASYELFLSDSQRTTSENLSALFSLLLRHSATFEIFSCLSVEILLPWPEGLVTR